MKSEFLPEAEKEFREAARYYENEASGVGLAFIIEVHKAVAAIVSHPLGSLKARGSIHKKVLNHFPYNVLILSKVIWLWSLPLHTRNGGPLIGAVGCAVVESDCIYSGNR